VLSSGQLTNRYVKARPTGRKAVYISGNRPVGIEGSGGGGHARSVAGSGARVAR